MSHFWEKEIPKGYYDKAISFDKKSKYDTQSNWHKTTFESISNKTKNSKILLDFACGSGTFLGHYIKKETSIGVDISETQILYAKEKYKDSGSFFTLHEFKFEDYKNYFDTITCIGLFEFISKEEADYYLERFKYCLKDNGKMIILDLLKHDHEWTREQWADQWLGFMPEELTQWLNNEHMDILHNEVLRGFVPDLSVIMVIGKKRK